MAQPVSVLFVCLGNICRSPMADGCFRHLTGYETAKQNPVIGEIDSCGTGAYHVGDYSDSRTLAILNANGITNYRHKARAIRVPDDFKRFDYILAMDEANLIDLRDMARRAIKKGQLDSSAIDRIHLYGEFGGGAKDEEIGDPYYGGRGGFSIAFEQVKRFGQGFLQHIEEQAATNQSKPKA